MLIDFLFVFVAIISAIFFAIKHRLTEWTSHVVPATKRTFLNSSLCEIGRRYHICEITKHHYDKHKTKGPFCGFFVYFSPAAIITDLDLVQNIMVTDFDCFHDRGMYYNEYHDPLSAHLFALKGEKWKMLRTKLTPFFDAGKMSTTIFDTVQIVAEHFKVFMERTIDANETDVEMKSVFGKYTMDVIGSCAFGIDCSTLHDENEQFVKMGRKFFEQPIHQPMPMQLLISQFRSIAKYLGVKKIPFQSYNIFPTGTSRYRQNIQVLREEFLNIVSELRNGRKNGVHSVFDLDDKEMAAQAFLFFLTGFETSSTLLTFCSYELAKNPEIQTKLRDEVRTVIANYNGECTYEALTQMKFLDQVLNGKAWQTNK